MLIAVKTLDLHNPLFCSGTNLSQKIDTTKRTGLKIQFDTENRWFIVQYNGKCKIVLEANAGDFEPLDPEALGITFDSAHVPPVQKVVTVGAAMTAGAAKTAQVETPHGKVQNPPSPPPRFKQ